jgi:hypothetical protein
MIEDGHSAPLFPTAAPNNPKMFTRAGGWLYFIARVGASADCHFYRTDGAALEEIDLGHGVAFNTYITHLISTGDNLYVLAPNRPEPGVYAITPAELATPADQAPIVTPLEIIPHEGNLYLISQRSAGGSAELSHVTPFQMSAIPSTLPAAVTVAGPGIYFTSGASRAETEIYRHSADGLFQVPSDYFQPYGPQPSHLLWASGKLYFNATDLAAGPPFEALHELTPPDTIRRLHRNPANWVREASGAIVFGNDRDNTLTILLQDLSISGPEATLSSDHSQWFPFEGGLVTRGNEPETGTELYLFDGEIVSLLVDLRPGPLSSLPQDISIVKLSSFDSSHPFEQWLASHGIPSGRPPEEWPALEDRFGAPLLLKYALDVNPEQPMPPLLIQSSDRDLIELSLTIPEGPVPGVTLIVETSETLVDCDWETLATRGPAGIWRQEFGFVSFDLHENRHTVTITVLREVDAGRYFRLRAEPSP